MMAAGHGLDCGGARRQDESRYSSEKIRGLFGKCSRIAPGEHGKTDMVDDAMEIESDGDELQDDAEHVRRRWTYAPP